MKTYGRITNMEAVLILGVKRFKVIQRGAGSFVASMVRLSCTATTRGMWAVTSVGAQSWKHSRLCNLIGRHEGGTLTNKFVQSLLDRFDYIKLVDKKSKNGKVKKVFKIKREVIEDAKKADFAGKGQREMEIAYA